jgi:hypothetical protein
MMAAFCDINVDAQATAPFQGGHRARPTGSKVADPSEKTTPSSPLTL